MIYSWLINSECELASKFYFTKLGLCTPNYLLYKLKTDICKNDLFNIKNHKININNYIIKII